MENICPELSDKNTREKSKEITLINIPIRKAIWVDFLYFDSIGVQILIILHLIPNFAVSYTRTYVDVNT